MAQRKPLVLVNGEIQQLQAGDSLVGDTDLNVISASNGEALAIVKGEPVYVTAIAGQVKKALGDNVGTAKVFGLVKDASIASSTQGLIQTEGTITATDVEWQAVNEGGLSLVPGQDYWLSEANAGKITANAPSAEGDVVCKIGRALSTTEFEISIGAHILL